MKQVRTHAYTCPDAGLWLHPHELRALFGLPAWMLGLFAHLVLRADFKTGAGRTGYGELINACTADEPERGRRFWAPSRDVVRKALRRIERLHILTLERGISEQLQSINFELAPRGRFGVAAVIKTRVWTPGLYEGKQPISTPGLDTGLSALKKDSPTSHVDNLIHRPNAEVAQRLKTLADKMRGGRKRAPEGA